MRWKRHQGVNRFRKYAVTVMDSWTPARLFWTERGARRWHNTFLAGAHLFRWNGDHWEELF